MGMAVNTTLYMKALMSSMTVVPLKPLKNCNSNAGSRLQSQDAQTGWKED